jgi:hypothetical protein
MGIIKAVAGLGAVAFAGVAYTMTNGVISPDAPAHLTAELPASRVAERFRLVLYGADTGCDVVKGDAVSARKAQLTFAADCAAELPDLAVARFWSEQEDGSVAFMGEDGKVTARFAAGDGHAFESYGAGAPLISLIAQDD